MKGAFLLSLLTGTLVLGVAGGLWLGQHGESIVPRAEAAGEIEQCI